MVQILLITIDNFINLYHTTPDFARNFGAKVWVRVIGSGKGGLILQEDVNSKGSKSAIGVCSV